MEMSVSSPQFGYESKSVLKINFIKSRVSNYIRFPLILKYLLMSYCQNNVAQSYIEMCTHSFQTHM